jgi:hypothetical protein
MSRLDEIEKRWKEARELPEDYDWALVDTWWLIAELRKSQARVRELEAALRGVAEWADTRDVIMSPGVWVPVGQALAAGEANEPYWQPCKRADGRMEWTCPHGVGHGNHSHGCCQDACCSRDDFPGKEEP